MRPIGLFELASQQALWLSARQAAVSQNIANASSPGYLARDVAPFEEVLAEELRGILITHPRHMVPTADFGGVSVDVSTTEAHPDGAPVTVEIELMKSIEVRRDYELNTSIVKAFNHMILNVAKV